MEVPDLPARQVVSRSPVRTVRLLNLSGIFPQPIECESSLERDFVFRAALCPGVVDLRHQPFQLTLKSGRRYTPDFLVRHADGSHLVVEVKVSTRIEGYRSIFDDAAEQLHAKGVAFAVADETAIREDRAHERAGLVLRYRKAGVSPELKALASEAAQRAPLGLTILELMQAAQASRQDVFHLVACRMFYASRALAIAATDLVVPHFPQGFHHDHRLEGWLGLAPWAAHA